MSTDHDDGQLWVRSDVMPDGSYGVGLNVGPDRSWALNRTQATDYAVACYTRATEAEHDAAVLTLLTHIGLPERTAAELIVKDLRPDRPDDHTPTHPLKFTVAIGRKCGPFLKMELDGHEVGELTTGDLRDHAAAVLNVIAAADLDAALFRALTGRVGLDEDRARAVVGDLADHWPAEQAPRRTGETA
jgi:hypothetical protein